MDLKDKTIAITGGGRGLGAAMALRLAARGAKLALVDLDEDALKSTASECEKAGSPQVAVYKANVAEEASVVTLFEDIGSDFGALHGLVNNAGITRDALTLKVKDGELVSKMTLDQWQLVIDVNLTGVFLCGREAAARMIATGSTGCIINISSMAADRAITRVVGYSSSKAAIDIFTKWLATEFSLKFDGKIRVNAIAPGFFIGNQNRRLLLNEDGSLTERGNTIVRNTPMKRFGEPEELNGAAQFLLSEASTFITGIVLPVDGGFSAFSGV